MNALVLAGGSILGAFQVGAIAKVLETYSPDIVYGVSVGALNAGYMANSIGTSNAAGKPLNWASVGVELKKFWTENITKPEQLVRQRHLIELIYQVALNKFDGLTDTAPLDNLVKKLIRNEVVKQCSVPVLVGFTNLNSGQFALGDSQQSTDFVQDILASAHLPLIMPIVRQGSQNLTDGGVVNVSPLKCALANQNVTNVVAISCHAPSVQPAKTNQNWGDLIAQASRVFDIMNREVLNDDLQRTISINDEAKKHPNNIIPNGADANKRFVPIVSIRPSTDFGIDITSFTKSDIDAMILAGEEAAAKEWAAQSHILV